MSDVETLLPPVGVVARPVDRRARRRTARRPASVAPRNVRRAVLRGVGAAVVVVLVTGGWVASRVVLAANSLLSATSAVEDVATSLTAAPTATLLESTQEVQAATARARDAVGDPLWRAAELVPGVGDRLEAVRLAVGAADVLAQEALGPIASLAGSVTFGPFPEDGEGYAALVQARELSGTFEAIADAVVRARDAVADVPTTDLFVPALSEPFAAALGGLEDAADVASALVPGMDAMLALSGHRGEAHTLVVVLDDRVPRALGGAVERAYMVRTEFGDVEHIAVLDSAALAAEAPGAASTPGVRAAARELRSAAEGLTGHAPGAVVLLSVGALERLADLADLAPEEAGLVSALAASFDALDAATRAQYLDPIVQALVRDALGLRVRADVLAVAVRDAVVAGDLRVWFADPAVQEPLAGTRGAGGLPAAAGDGVPVTVALHAGGTANAAVTAVRTAAGRCGSWWDSHPVSVLEVELAPAGGGEAAATPRLLVGLPDGVRVAALVDGEGRALEVRDRSVDGHRLLEVAADASLGVVRLEITGRAGTPAGLVVTPVGVVPDATEGAARPICG